jgi:hypothetical protein
MESVRSVCPFAIIQGPEVSEAYSTLRRVVIATGRGPSSTELAIEVAAVPEARLHILVISRLVCSTDNTVILGIGTQILLQ